MAFLGCLFKFGMGFLHGDANTRQCMATAVTAYKQSFGFDAPPCTYADFEESDVIVLVGSNLCIAHPILWQRIMRNRRPGEDQPRPDHRQHRQVRHRLGERMASSSIPCAASAYSSPSARPPAPPFRLPHLPPDRQGLELRRALRQVDSPPADLPETPDAAYPFTLLTGRGTSSKWHTQSRTGKSDILRKLSPQQAYVEIHPADASRLSLREHDTVTIRSRRGGMRASVYLAPTVQPGQVFLPMHYPEVNRLTHPSFVPHSRQPNYKACAVAVEKL
jgi:anaerobic selenocysteine-containing dehydrogenase